MSGAPRLVIYGLGPFGQRIARFAVDKGYPVIAAYNRAGPKVGVDLGRLIGLDREYGVVIEDTETADYGRISADIGIVTQTNLLGINMPAYRRLAGAGLNILCHGVESYLPHASAPDLAAEIDEMARAAGITFTGSGIWDMSRIWAGLLIAGPCTELRALDHVSVTDATRNGLAELRATGVGMDHATHAQFARTDRAVFAYRTIPEHVLWALGYTVTERAYHTEAVLFDEPMPCPLLGRDIPAGEPAGSRAVIRINTAEGVTATASIEVRLMKPDEQENMLWSVDGAPVTRLRTEREDSSHASASCLFNRIPDVIAAPPGIVPVSKLGPLRPSALVGRL